MRRPGRAPSASSPSDELTDEIRPSRILLAEDDAELRRLLAAGLRREGYEVIEAKDGLQVIECLRAPRNDPLYPDNVDLVICDVRMPGQTGLELLARVRRSECALPVILMTAFADRATYAAARRLGAAAVFDKPFDLEEFRSTVAGVVPP